MSGGARAYAEPSPALREPKPRWEDVPPAARQALARKLGQAIAAGEVAWGGYGPGATFKLTLADGTRRFVKSPHPGQTADGNAMVSSEIASFERFPCLAGTAPAYFGHQPAGDWHWLILELVADATQPPPWTTAQIEALFAAAAAFYDKARAARHLPGIEAEGAAKFDLALPVDAAGWIAIQDDPRARGNFTAAFIDNRAAETWLDAALPRLVPLQRARREIGGPSSLIHFDLRSDNVLFRRDGSAVILDWSETSWGPVVLDLCGFAPSCIGEGGADGDELRAAFSAATGARFSDDDVAIALANVAGYFASRVGTRRPAGLPRLPWVLRQQLWSAMRWAERTIDVPPLPALRATAR
jgi:hypothetical protein